MGIGTTVLIVAIVLIVVLVVAVAAAVFVFYTPALISRVSPRTGPVAVTGLFLEIFYPNSSYNGYFGNSLRPIGYAIPIYLQHNQIYQTQFTLTLAPGRNRTIDQISVASSNGFRIQSYSPTLPVTMTPGSSTIFTVTLQAPSTDYMGPVTIDLYTY